MYLSIFLDPWVVMELVFVKEVYFSYENNVKVVLATGNES